MSLEYMVFNNEMTTALFLHLSLPEIIKFLDSCRLECQFEYKNGSNHYNLLQRKELAKFLDNIVNQNYKEWPQIEEFANIKIGKM